MKQRRFLLGIAAALPGLLLGSITLCLPLQNVQAQAQPRYTVSAEQLQGVVAERFPMQYPVAGLVDLQIQAPSLRLLPAANRLGAEMQLKATGPALGRTYTGVFDVDFALRYEASDQTIRAYQLHVNSLRLSGLPPEVSMLLSAYGNQLADQTLLEVTVQQLRQQDLALADAMGLVPGRITVTDQGLVVEFVGKSLR